MRRIVGALMICAASVSASAQERQVLGNAYMDCMKTNAAKYGRKASTADEAIDAATSVCKDKRAALREVLRKEQVGKVMLGNTPNSDYTAQKLADMSLEKLDAKLRPDWVRAVLDAK